MKKKTIEKIPPITVRFEGEKDYLAAAGLKNVSGERILLIDFWRRKEKDCVYRTVLTKKEFANYDFMSGVWNSRKFDDPHPQGCEKSIGQHSLGKVGGEEKVRRFTKGAEWMDVTWCIRSYEENILSNKEWERMKKRKEKLDERCRNMPPLPDGKWISEKLGHIIFYKRKGRYCDILCPVCGLRETYVTSRLEGFEGMAEAYIETPREGNFARCPRCGAAGKYIGMGRIEKTEISKSYYVIQKYQDGAVVRYLEGKKRFTEYGESLSNTEIARAFFLPGKKIQKDYHKYDPYRGQNFWDDCNLSGMANIALSDADIYPGYQEELSGTYLRYSAIEEYKKHKNRMNPARYLEQYIKFPFLEMVVKSGMDRLAENIIQNDIRGLDLSGKTIWDILQVKKESLKTAVEYKGSRAALTVLQTERDLQIRIRPETEKKLIAVMPDKQKLKTALRYMSPEQLINRIEKYSGCKIRSENCSNAEGCIGHVKTTYLDYLWMREELGYDLTNSVFAYPRDLEAAHRKMVFESEKGKLDKRILEVNSKYADIEKNFKKLDKKYHYEADGFLIRPAKDAGEIVMEGRILHHCVGGDGYLSKHNSGKTAILFLRFLYDPETPYVTIEIDGTHIIQWYGAYDKKPDEQHLQGLLDGYTKKLEEKMRKAG